MSDEREELKGRLLQLWLEDLKNDRVPGVYPECELLKASELEEILGVARFVKGNLYPSITMPVDVGDYAKELSKVVLQERADQSQLNKAAIEKAETFGQLISRIVSSLGMDRTILQRSLTLPRAALSDLESEKLPPHRLPVETIVRLLVALRLASTEVVELIKISARRWAIRVYSSDQTQLGRIDISLSNDERLEVMAQKGDLGKELRQIDNYCAKLVIALSSIKDDQDPTGSPLADDGTWLRR